MEWKTSNRLLGGKTTHLYKYSWSNISGFFSGFFKFSGRELKLFLIMVNILKDFVIPRSMR